MSSAPTDSGCIICLDSDPPPIQSGCACRGDGGLAHVGCLTEKAVSQQAYRGNEVWWECQTCEQNFTGAMRFGLAEAWWSRVCKSTVHRRSKCFVTEERLSAAGNLAVCRREQGKYAEAETIHREVLSMRRRVLGEEHPDTLTGASDLASSLSEQGKYAEAGEMFQATLTARQRVLGSAHPDTLGCAQRLKSVRIRRSIVG